MTTIWSDKKWVDKTINILLFLVAVNFLHYGQLILPVICLILFIDNKFNFKVNNIVTFVILCLFAISFCAFSYKLGFYCVMGFCLPMAYYIGSNIKNVNEENIKKIIYIIVFGMATHILLNFAYDLFIYGIKVFRKNKHYDIWTKTIVQSTGLATNCLFVISLIYYFITYEKNSWYKKIGILLFAIMMIYNVGLGRRTPLFTFVIVFVISFIFDYFINKNQNINKKIIKWSIIIVILFALVLTSMYIFNIFDMRRIIGDITLFQKFSIDGIDPKRIDILFESIKLFPKYLLGGQNISQELGIQVHDLWFDIYDYSGIIPFLLIVAYTIILIIMLYRIIFKSNTSKEFKLMVTEVSLCAFFVFVLEPTLTGCSIFLICSIIMFSAIEEIQLKENSI